MTPPPAEFLFQHEKAGFISSTKILPITSARQGRYRRNSAQRPWVLIRKQIVCLWILRNSRLPRPARSIRIHARLRSRERFICWYMGSDARRFADQTNCNVNKIVGGMKCSCLAELRGGGAFAEFRRQFSGRQRLAKEVALGFVATVFAQLRQLSGAFHAFGCDSQF